MGVQFYYTSEQRLPSAGLPELAFVTALHDVEALDGSGVAEGSKGTIVSIHDGGSAYAVEFSGGRLVVIEAEGVRAV